MRVSCCALLLVTVLGGCSPKVPVDNAPPVRPHVKVASAGNENRNDGRPPDLVVRPEAGNTPMKEASADNENRKDGRPPDLVVPAGAGNTPKSTSAAGEGNLGGRDHGDAGKAPDPGPGGRASNGKKILNAADEELLRRWFRRSYSPQDALRVAQICADAQVTREEVLSLIGHPNFRDTPTQLFYNYAPSCMLELYFDDAGNLIQVDLNGKSIQPR